MSAKADLNNTGYLPDAHDELISNFRFDVIPVTLIMSVRLQTFTVV